MVCVNFLNILENLYSKVFKWGSLTTVGGSILIGQNQ